MQSQELLKSKFARIVGISAAALLAAGVAISSASAESALGSALFDMPPPPVEAAAPVVAPTPQFMFESPMPGFRVNSRVGFRKLRGEKGRMHEGVDFAAPTGVAIKCASDGEVLRAGLSPSYGNFVEVDHGDGVTTFYAHMSRRAATPGEHVKAGTVLGYVGATGHVTGPHLHFEVRKNEHQFDPMRVIGRTFASLNDIPFPGRARLIAASDRTPAAPVPYTVLNGRVSATLR
jgi:murein DD-endopeptidase MepM/ murein hydrolase activator NlpD